jgi:hypothetical protein
MKQELKEVDDEFRKGGQRDWVQVVSGRCLALQTASDDACWAVSADFFHCTAAIFKLLSS